MICLVESWLTTLIWNSIFRSPFYFQNSKEWSYTKLDTKNHQQKLSEVFKSWISFMFIMSVLHNLWVRSIGSLCWVVSSTRLLFLINQQIEYHCKWKFHPACTFCKICKSHSQIFWKLIWKKYITFMVLARV